MWRRRLAISATLAAVALLVAIVVYAFAAGGRDFVSVASVKIGGPFTLTTQSGTKLSDSDLKGEPFALFFGFTHCPEVCPTTLWEMSEALKALGPDADKLKVLFISIDPTRDDPEALALYLQSFDPPDRRPDGKRGGDRDCCRILSRLLAQGANRGRRLHDGPHRLDLPDGCGRRVYKHHQLR
ncbi:SCO1/SenC family protein [Falsochrobactrum ovis]|uniref:SCO1/SenC family protein n=1 Tax=Falsochrobactrum ovis TaxID=1293442 RepID=A0A364JSB7_9HYPH|nr:SCO1/SenC family protein [Falsochrobactrum ovis]